MKKIAVFHFMPLEFYPPVMNFLDIVSEESSQIRVYSTENNKERKRYCNKKLNSIFRVALPSPKDNGIVRLIKYLNFNVKCFFALVKFKPEEIIYFESYSAGPVYWYLRFYGKNKGLKIHYHEYAPPQWYENGMRLVKKYHTFETKFLYRKADWISQTNKDRVELFLNDNPEVDAEKMKILPNYPPKSWHKNYKDVKSVNNKTLKAVYVGSLSLEATFIQEYCEWVMSQKGKVTFDVYSYNLHEDTYNYLANLRSPYIHFFEDGIEYRKLPSIISKYDVGLILYKGLNDNFIYNAPNKLFEYLACGLDVWCSDKMLGVIPYLNEEKPRVIHVDFLEIDFEILLKSRNQESKAYENKTLFSAEDALGPLVKKLLS